MIAWNIFKNTGNINAFLEYKYLENMGKRAKEEQNINIAVQNNTIDSNILEENAMNINSVNNIQNGGIQKVD
jgi:hypothetical protein